ncbi:MAG: PAS domain S-box protein [Burkholderiaceae bacterium]
MLESRPLEFPAEIQRSQYRRRDLSLRWMFLFIAAAMVVMAALESLLAPPGTSLAWMALTLGAISLLLYFTMRSAQGRWHRQLMVASIMVIACGAMVRYGSVRSSSTFALLGSVVMAGTYLSLRALLVTAFAALLILAGVTWGEAGGHFVKPSMAGDLRFWLMCSIIVLWIGVQLHHTRKATDEAYLRQLNQLEDRLRLEDERGQSLRRFQRIFQLNPTPLLIYSASTQAILDVNPAFERFFGFEGEKVIGQASRVLWVDEQQWHRHSQALSEQGRTDWIRVQWRRADGQISDVLVCSNLSEDSGDMLVLTTVVAVPDSD